MVYRTSSSRHQIRIRKTTVDITGTSSTRGTAMVLVVYDEQAQSGVVSRNVQVLRYVAQLPSTAANRMLCCVVLYFCTCITSLERVGRVGFTLDIDPKISCKRGGLDSHPPLVFRS